MWKDFKETFISALVYAFPFAGGFGFTAFMIDGIKVGINFFVGFLIPMTVLMFIGVIIEPKFNIYNKGK